MERVDVSESPWLSALVDAAERGDEVVLVRAGRVVAELKASEPGVRQQADRHAALLALRAAAAPLRVSDATLLIREMRDADRH